MKRALLFGDEEDSKAIRAMEVLFDVAKEMGENRILIWDVIKKTQEKLPKFDRSDILLIKQAVWSFINEGEFHLHSNRTISVMPKFWELLKDSRSVHTAN